MISLAPTIGGTRAGRVLAAAIGASALLALIAGLIPAGAEGKVGCEGQHASDPRVVFEGLPREPESAVSYGVAVELPDEAVGNPRPLLFLLRCEVREQAEIAELGLAITESEGNRVRSEFRLEFPNSGQWQLTLMDRGGMFHGLGTYEVRGPSAGMNPELGAGLPASLGDAGRDSGRGGLFVGVMVAPALLLLAVLGLAVRRRRLGSVDRSSLCDDPGSASSPGGERGLDR